jgi:hypothetical protein
LIAFAIVRDSFGAAVVRRGDHDCSYGGSTSRWALASQQTRAPFPNKSAEFHSQHYASTTALSGPIGKCGERGMSLQN